MKIFISTVIILSSLIAMNVYARDSISGYSIEEAMAREDVKSKLGNEIQFYFGDQAYSKPTKNFGEFSTNKKTNAFNKSDKEACQWAFFSAMLSLKKRVQNQGGNAVVNIKSNYKNNLTSSNDSFQCGAGTMIAGVALVGTVVKLD